MIIIKRDNAAVALCGIIPLTEPYELASYTAPGKPCLS